MSRRATSARRVNKIDKARTISVVDYLFEGEQTSPSSRNIVGQRFGKMKECVRDAPAALAENGGPQVAQLN